MSGTTLRGGGAGLSQIRVVIVDDHAVVRSGLELLLDAEEDIEVVGEAGNLQEAVFRTRSLKPDVVLMDIVMPVRAASRRRRQC